MSRIQSSKQDSADGKTIIDRLPPPILVDTAPVFNDMLDDLSRQPALALDTESNSLYRYFYQVCLIQISTPSTDYLVDPLRLRDVSPLGEILADATVQKVFHAAENDIVVLKRDFGFRFAHIFDTMLAARILGWPQVSLAALLSTHFNVTLDKRTQLTDWGRRPLTPAQLSYARLDSRYLLPLRDLLQDELQARGRWREAQEAFSALPDLVPTERIFDPEGFWRLKGARDLSPRELAVLRELYLWRNDQAQKMDVPPFKVLDDRSLIRLSRSQPGSKAELRLSDWQLRHFGVHVLEAVARGAAAAPPRPPARSQNEGYRPDAATLARFDRLRSWRGQRASERGVDSDIVLSNDLLMQIARAAPTTLEELAALGLLGDWKLQEYGPDLLEVIHSNDVRG